MGIDFDHIRKNIEEQKYPIIGAGTARIVYDCKNGYVVKAAKNNKGFVQNKAEKEIEAKDTDHIFAKVLACSEDYKYLVMEKAERINSIAEVWKFYNVRNNRELFQQDSFKDLYIKYNLLYPDLCRQNSWGLVDGKPVIIDFGFTRETRKYYTQFFRFYKEK